MPRQQHVPAMIACQGAPLVNSFNACRSAL
jgi:hypothetical protein